MRSRWSSSPATPTSARPRASARCRVSAPSASERTTSAAVRWLQPAARSPAGPGSALQRLDDLVLQVGEREVGRLLGLERIARRARRGLAVLGDIQPCAEDETHGVDRLHPGPQLVLGGLLLLEAL